MNTIFLGYPPENIKNFILNLKYCNPLCFEAVDTGATIALTCNGNNLKTATFQTSTDGQSWTDYTYATNITLTNAGDKVYFKAKDDNTSIERTMNDYLQFTTTQESKKVNVSGNVMSLLSPEFGQMKSVSSYCFYSLFGSCTNIYDCSSITLPATTLADYCYSYMFFCCTNLTAAPALPATNLADYCYNYMFGECINLTSAPELPATTLASGCYSEMFTVCSNLIEAPELPATTLASNCYNKMFENCTSLTQAPDLPATTLIDDCYSFMFNSCTNLTATPALPATTLADYCYCNMFKCCTSLSTAPALPATTLATWCYFEMFSGCSSLTAAPIIKTYTSDLEAFSGMLAAVDYDTYEWGQLSVCNWPDLTLSEVESMVLSENIFGSGEDNIQPRISITCKDGSATVYFDSKNWSWVFER